VADTETKELAKDSAVESLARGLRESVDEDSGKDA
jgi:hypothetical protein